MSYSPLPASFEYLCYGSTSIINVNGRQNLTSNVDPRAEKIKIYYSRL